jgi:hypothetical protein
MVEPAPLQFREGNDCVDFSTSHMLGKPDYSGIAGEFVLNW